MAEGCEHVDTVNQVVPQTLGCAECLATGGWWVHLRLCRSCGHVGCCDDSPSRHATAHFHATRHPIMEGYDPPEGWGWCYVDKTMIDFEGDTTPQRGPLPHFFDEQDQPVEAAFQALKNRSAAEGRPGD